MFSKGTCESITYMIFRQRIGSSWLELHLHCLSSHITRTHMILKFFWLGTTISHWNLKKKKKERKMKFNHIVSPSCNLSKLENRYQIQQFSIEKMCKHKIFCEPLTATKVQCLCWFLQTNLLELWYLP